jgi:D-3-phosphoglycerate dehydrogenase
MATGKKRVLVILPKSFQEAGYEYLTEAFNKVDIQVKGFCEDRSPNSEELLSLVSDVEGYVSGWGEPINENVASHANRLRVITEFGVGVEHIDLEACSRKGIIVANAPGVNSVAVMELAIGLLLSLARNICKINARTKTGFWELSLGTQIKNKTLGVIGTGNIGKGVANVAVSLGMKVLTYDIQQNEQLVKEGKVEYVKRFEEIFSRADFITIHIPLSPETKGMIKREHLNLMKKSAYLINTARGAIVDEEALYEILRNNQIAGAALDVFSEEPPIGSKLLQLENVLTTSHIGGATFEAVRETARANYEDIIKVFSGGSPSHVVNPQVSNYHK